MLPHTESSKSVSHSASALHTQASSEKSFEEMTADVLRLGRELEDERARNRKLDKLNRKVCECPMSTGCQDLSSSADFFAGFVSTATNWRLLMQGCFVVFKLTTHRQLPSYQQLLDIRVRSLHAPKSRSEGLQSIRGAIRSQSLIFAPLY